MTTSARKPTRASLLACLACAVVVCACATRSPANGFTDGTGDGGSSSSGGLDGGSSGGGDDGGDPSFGPQREGGVPGSCTVTDP